MAGAVRKRKYKGGCSMKEGRNALYSRENINDVHKGKFDRNEGKQVGPGRQVLYSTKGGAGIIHKRARK